MRKHKGLTLIELLVAISVLGFVAILGWRGLDGIVRARIALTSDLEQTRGMQIAFAQLDGDCAHLASASTLLNRTALAVEPERLTLVRTVFADNQPTRLQVITYRVKNGVLTRQESVATRDLGELDTLWLTAVNDLNSTQPPFDAPATKPGIGIATGVALQSNVTALAMRLWVNGAWLNGIGASTPAAAATSPAVPTGLEVTLQLRGNDSGIRKIFLLGAV